MATALLLPSPRARAVETPHRCAHWPARLLRRGACCRATQLQGSQRQQAVSDLLNAIEGTDRGVNTTAEQRQQIFQAIGALEALTASEDGAVKQDDSEGVSATWKLLWTTEKVMSLAWQWSDASCPCAGLRSCDQLLSWLGCCTSARCNGCRAQRRA